jgi:hypothetical protein
MINGRRIVTIRVPINYPDEMLADSASATLIYDEQRQNNFIPAKGTDTGDLYGA